MLEKEKGIFELCVNQNVHDKDRILIGEWKTWPSEGKVKNTQRLVSQH